MLHLTAAHAKFTCCTSCISCTHVTNNASATQMPNEKSVQAEEWPSNFIVFSRVWPNVSQPSPVRIEAPRYDKYVGALTLYQAQNILRWFLLYFFPNELLYIPHVGTPKQLLFLAKECHLENEWDNTCPTDHFHEPRWDTRCPSAHIVLQFLSLWHDCSCTWRDWNHVTQRGIARLYK